MPPVERARLMIRSVRWVLGYPTDRVESIKCFSYPQNMIMLQFLLPFKMQDKNVRTFIVRPAPH